MDAFSGFYVDEKAARVENIFFEFLKQFKEDGAGEPFYEAEMEAMRSRESTTMFVDFEHIMHFNDIIQKALSEEYLRFEPCLKNASKRFVLEHQAGENRAPIILDDSPNKDIDIAFYNIPMLKRLRELGTPEIGKLTSVMGVVTRTSEVRPKLLQGTFKCLDCGNVVKNVEQQFKYTEVLRLDPSSSSVIHLDPSTPPDVPPLRKIPASRRAPTGRQDASPTSAGASTPTDTTPPARCLCFALEHPPNATPPPRPAPPPP